MRFRTYTEPVFRGIGQQSRSSGGEKRGKEEKGVDKVGAVWYSNKAVREDRGRKARKTDENIENFRKDLKKVLDKALEMW